LSLSVEQVRAVFTGLQTAGGAPFFEHVADNVDWTVQGTRPLAGHYRSKQAFVAATFAKIGPMLQGGVKFSVVNIMVSGD
jgi:ketosteroid isomerase-like protein